TQSDESCSHAPVGRLNSCQVHPRTAQSAAATKRSDRALHQRFPCAKGLPMPNDETLESDVPARLDALPWSSWHWLIVVSLGATWILDGLEVTLAGALGGILTLPQTLGLTPARVGASATCYLAGAVLGALLFGYGTDRF